MKVLWTTNGAIDKAATVLQKQSHVPGGWMTPFLRRIKDISDIQLVIVTSGSNTNILSLKDDNVTYYILPGGHSIAKYNGFSEINILLWRSIIETEHPDLIHIWGCESSIGIAALQACDNAIPSIIFVQGVGVATDRCCEAGIDRKTQRKMASIRDYLRMDAIWMQHRRYQKMLNNERWLLRKSMNSIVESRWCIAFCNSIAPGIRNHYLPLVIDEVFFSIRWSADYDKHTIMCPLSYSPIKGHHMLIKALGIIKKKYPDVQLRIPGNKKVPSGIGGKLKESGYNRYLNQLIRDNDLDSSVKYLGIMSANEMAVQMQRSHVFVMCSAIENHSSSLKEAMTVGVPCIASDVGGVTDYARHRENALIYRFEDYELLASYICECFENETLCGTLSANARGYASDSWRQDKTVDPILNIYKSIIEGYRTDGK